MNNDNWWKEIIEKIKNKKEEERTDLEKLFLFINNNTKIKIVDQICHNKEPEQLVIELNECGQISLFNDGTWGWFPYEED